MTTSIVLAVLLALAIVGLIILFDMVRDLEREKTTLLEAKFTLIADKTALEKEKDSWSEGHVEIQENYEAQMLDLQDQVDSLTSINKSLHDSIEKDAVLIQNLFEGHKFKDEVIEHLKDCHRQHILNCLPVLDPDHFEGLPSV